MALYTKAWKWGILFAAFVFSLSINLAYARLPDFGLDYRIPAHFGNTPRTNDPSSTCVHFDMPPWDTGIYPNVGSFKIGTAVDDGTYSSSPSGGTGIPICSLDAPGNITQEGATFLTVYEFPNYVNPLGFIEFSCTTPVLNAGDCSIVTPPPVDVCTTHCFTEPINSIPNNLYYPISVHFNESGTTLFCDTPYYNNEEFGSYSIGIFPGDDLYSNNNTTNGTGLCTGSFNAPGNILMPGVNYLTMYTDNNHSLPYGFVEFYCTEPVANTGDCVIVPYTIDPAICTENCFSNVLFLPGMMGSRLYENEEELWVSTSDGKQERMSLDENGKGIYGVYTKNDTQRVDGEGDETGIVDDVFNLNIYQSFLNNLKDWEDEEGENIIKDYAFIPYDWRLSLEDIITNGKVVGDNLIYDSIQDLSESFVLEKLRELQSTSRTGKVTIIAHSYGGLVAKALIEELKETNDPLYNQIDKLILVAVPQIGTPEASVSILHGLDIGGGFLMNNERSRQLSENMPTIYNLLPTDEYYNTVDPEFEADKLVTFQSQLLLEPQVLEYGAEISNTTELKNYILGSDGREKPSFEDTTSPNIGNSYLYGQAEDTHEILDNWQPSSDTKVIQVAGWGVETIAGLDYKVYAGLLPGQEYVSYVPRKVIDGDKTVVTPSALWISENNPNVERWWVDLSEYNNPKNFNFPRDHKHILEVSNLRDFIKYQIKKTSESNSFYDEDNIMIDDAPISNSNNIRLHYVLHSPLTLGIRDSEGRYTGLDSITGEIKQEIPDVTYEQIGEVQFLSIPEGIPYTLEMKGYEEGVFALDIEKQEGNQVVEKTSFQGIPSSDVTIANIDISPSLDILESELQLDSNGDGIIDKIIDAQPDGVAVYDTLPPELNIAFSKNKKDVVFSAEDLLDENPNITISNNYINLSDNFGNTTNIPFNRFTELPTRLRLSYNKIIRNGVTTNVPNTHIIYEWKEKNRKLTDLDTRVFIKGEERYVFEYIKSKNVTIIGEKMGNKMKWKTKKGFVEVSLITNGTSLEVHY